MRIPGNIAGADGAARRFETVRVRDRFNSCGGDPHLAREGVAIVDGRGERVGTTGPILSVYFNDLDGNPR